MKSNKDNQQIKFQIESFQERLKKREIWVNGPITNNLVETLYTNILRLQEESNQLPITVVVNSLGGLFYESIVATDMMGTTPNLVKTIALANAVSGGFIIFMGGQERICHDYTCLMMHSSSFSINTKIADIRDRVKYSEYAHDKMARFLSIQTERRTTPEYWKELFESGKDKWFSIEEALKLGIVHRVIKRKSMIDPNFTIRKPYTWDILDFKRANQ